MNPTVDPYWQHAAVEAGTWQARDAVGGSWKGEGFSKSSAQHIKNYIFDSMFPTAGRAQWAKLEPSTEDLQQQFQLKNAKAQPLTLYKAVPTHALGKGKFLKLKWSLLNDHSARSMPLLAAVNDKVKFGFTGVDCSLLDPSVPDLKFGVVALDHDWRLCMFLSDKYRIVLMTGAFKSNHGDNQDGYRVPVGLWNENNKKLFHWA